MINRKVLVSNEKQLGKKRSPLSHSFIALKHWIFSRKISQSKLFRDVSLQRERVHVDC